MTIARAQGVGPMQYFLSNTVTVVFIYLHLCIDRRLLKTYRRYSNDYVDAEARQSEAGV